MVADSYLPHLSDDAREELITGLIGPGCPGPLIPQGLTQLVNAVREAVLVWGAGRHFDADWLHQWYLAIQACALMFIQREHVPDRDGWWFFRLAARASWAYLDEMGMDRPSTAPVLSPRTLSGANRVRTSEPTLGTVNGTATAKVSSTPARAPHPGAAGGDPLRLRAP